MQVLAEHQLEAEAGPDDQETRMEAYTKENEMTILYQNSNLYNPI